MIHTLACITNNKSDDVTNNLIDTSKAQKRSVVMERMDDRCQSTMLHHTCSNYAFADINDKLIDIGGREFVMISASETSIQTRARGRKRASNIYSRCRTNMAFWEIR
jgi:hypothetical protein